MMNYGKYFEGQTTRTQKQYGMMKTERAFRGARSPHSKAICDAEDREESSRDKQPALENNMRS
jgi:hypothetical protein